MSKYTDKRTVIQWSETLYEKVANEAAARGITVPAYIRYLVMKDIEKATTDAG